MSSEKIKNLFGKNKILSRRQASLKKKTPIWRTVVRETPASRESCAPKLNIPQNLSNHHNNTIELWGLKGPLN